ncbi:MAG TPA: hypothetical protein VIH05_06095 [Tepidiformaceae bacterium]
MTIGWQDHGGAPHPPAPPEPRHLLPPWPIFLRGVGLFAMALTLLAFAWKVVRLSLLLGAPVALVLGAGGLLAAWGAAIHLTGGEKFDDHPWV